jgi:hypothetical protein
MTRLTYKGQTRPLVREDAQQQQIPDQNTWIGSNVWSNVHKVGSTPRHTDWLSETLTLTLTLWLWGKTKATLRTGQRCRPSYLSLASNPSLSRSSKLVYDWRSVSQDVVVSSTLVGLATRYYFLSECYSLKFAVLFLWGVFSDERTSLQFAV